MKLWFEIDEKTGFEAGDILARANEVISRCDGDRSSFEPYRKMTLRPVKKLSTFALLHIARMDIAAKLRELAHEIETDEE